MNIERINSITLKNYKNLDDCTLSVNNISALVGSNNSGKSNFLEVFRILNLLLFKGDEGKKRVKNYIGSYFVTNELPTFIEFNFDYISEKNSYNCLYNLEIKSLEDSFKILKENFSYKEKNKTGPYRNLFSRDNDSLRLREESGNRSISGTQTSIEFINFTFPDSKSLPSADFKLILGIFEIASTSVFRVHSLTDYNRLLQKTYKKLYELQQKKDERYTEFKDAFCDILDLNDFKLNEYKVPDTDHIIYITFVGLTSKIKYCPLEETSDGTKILFLMLYNIFIEKNSIVVIDEPEIGLHPKAITGFLKLFLNKNLNKQLILATHSTFILNSISPSLINLIDRSEDGKSSIKNVTQIKDLNQKLKSKYINFGDIFANNFITNIDTSL